MSPLKVDLPLYIYTFYVDMDVRILKVYSWERSMIIQANSSYILVVVKVGCEGFTYP